MTSSLSDSLVLGTGATGGTGRGVVEALVECGVPVRAMVRREADRGSFPAGVQAAAGDFDGLPCRLARNASAGRSGTRSVSAVGWAR